MANDCLVTKLKKSVTNNNLLKLGEHQILFKQISTTSTLQMSSNGEQTVKFSVPVTIGGNSVTEYLLTGNTTATIPANQDVIFTFDKYKIQNITSYGGNAIIEFNGLNYITSINNFGFDSTYSINWNIKLEELVMRSQITQFDFRNFTGISGNISALSNYTNIVLIKLYNDDERKEEITGELSSLANLVRLTELNLKATKVEGSLESFADAMVASPNSRTSGTLEVTGNGIITYNGTSYTGKKTITFNSSLPNGYSIA